MGWLRDVRNALEAIVTRKCGHSMPTNFGIEARAILRAFGRSAEAESRYDSLANHNDPWKAIFRGRSFQGVGH